MVVCGDSDVRGVRQDGRQVERHAGKCMEKQEVELVAEKRKVTSNVEDCKRWESGIKDIPMKWREEGICCGNDSEMMKDGERGESRRKNESNVGDRFGMP
eukprot:749180-Hanusia_phi.AAC.5